MVYDNNIVLVLNNLFVLVDNNMVLYHDKYFELNNKDEDHFHLLVYEYLSSSQYSNQLVMNLVQFFI